MPHTINQIPFPGGSGRTPTGALQFQNDFPGLFLRGDKTISLACMIRGRQQRLGAHPDAVVGAVLIQLGEIAEIIERDVIVREA